jgi:hypothetical protein
VHHVELGCHDLDRSVAQIARLRAAGVRVLWPPATDPGLRLGFQDVLDGEGKTLLYGGAR